MYSKSLKIGKARRNMCLQAAYKTGGSLTSTMDGRVQRRTHRWNAISGHWLVTDSIQSSPWAQQQDETQHSWTRCVGWKLCPSPHHSCCTSSPCCPGPGSSRWHHSDQKTHHSHQTACNWTSFLCHQTHTHSCRCQDPRLPGIIKLHGNLAC